MTEPTAPAAKRLEIKKYPNRRYYDSTHSRHLTLEEIRTLIQQGYDLRVVDAKTNADITAQVLTQIILELDTAKLDSLPVPLLVRLIRMNDQLIKDFIEKYFNQALHSFLDYQQQIEEQIRRSHGLPPLFPSVSAWTRALIEPFTKGFTPPAAEAPAPPAAAAPPAGDDMAAQIRRLEGEVARLKAAAGAPPGRRARRRRQHRGKK